MITRVIDLPVFFRVGQGLLGNVASILTEEHLVFHRVLVISGSSGTAGSAQFVAEKLDDAHTRVVGIVPIENNSITTVDFIKERIAHLDADLLLGVGGGKVLDTAKLAAYEKRIPFLALPTALSNDGIASPVSVVGFPQGVKSIGSRIPLGIIVDTKVVNRAPNGLTLAGVGDLLSNLSASEDWHLAARHGKDKVDTFADMLARSASERFLYLTEIRDGGRRGDYEFITALAEGLIASGLAMAIAGTSRPCSGAEHLISHALDQLLPKPFPHGVQVAIATLWANCLRGNEWRMLRQVFKNLGMAITPEELGISQEQFFQAVAEAPRTRPGRFTVLQLHRDRKEWLEAYEKVYHQ